MHATPLRFPSHSRFIMVLQSPAAVMLLLAVTLLMNSASGQRGVVVEDLPVDPSINLTDIFADQPPATPSSGIIRPVSTRRARKCDRRFKNFALRTGFLSKALLACCLFGPVSGLCRPELTFADPQAPLCNNNTAAAPRNPRHRHWPIGQCCMFTNARDRFQYECFEDQSAQVPDCDAQDARCGLRNVDCGYEFLYLPPEMKPVSQYVDAGVRLISARCFARPQPIALLGDALSSCCGIGTTNRTLCQNFCLRRVSTCSKIPYQNCSTVFRRH